MSSTFIHSAKFTLSTRTQQWPFHRIRCSLRTSDYRTAVFLTRCTERIRATLARLLAIQVQVPIKHPHTNRPAVLIHICSRLLSFPRKLNPALQRRYVIAFRSICCLYCSLRNRWGRIKGKIVCAMSSKYAIALYELLPAPGEHGPLRRGLSHCSLPRSARRSRRNQQTRQRLRACCD